MTPTGERWQRAIDIAEKRFPTSICEPVVYTHGRLPRGIGSFSSSDCRITISSSTRLKWSNLCRTMVHERGHAAGYGHSTNSRSIMYPIITVVPHACRGKWNPRV